MKAAYPPARPSRGRYQRSHQHRLHRIKVGNDHRFEQRHIRLRAAYAKHRQIQPPSAGADFRVRTHFTIRSCCICGFKSAAPSRRRQTRRKNLAPAADRHSPSNPERTPAVPFRPAHRLQLLHIFNRGRRQRQRRSPINFVFAQPSHHVRFIAVRIAKKHDANLRRRPY